MSQSNEAQQSLHVATESASSRRARAARGGVISLPVAGLPPGVGDVNPGECAVLLIETSQPFQNSSTHVATPASGPLIGFHDRAMAATLRRTLSAGFPRTTALWLGAARDEPLAVGPALRAAVGAGRLIPLQWAADAAQQITHRGPERVLKELGACGLRRREALLIEACAPWWWQARDATELMAHTGALLAACLAVHRGPLLCVAPARFHTEPLAEHFARLDLQGLPPEGIERIATLHAEDGSHPVVEFLAWPALQGPAVNQRAFGLVERRTGGRNKVGWQADGSALAMDAQLLLDADDASRVLTVQAVANSRFGPPPGWELWPDIEAIETACRYAVAATVVLPYVSVEEFPVLAMAVYRLRRDHPRALKIVVRELGDRLRHGQESVLLRLGANQVVYRDVSLSRLEQAVKELRERLFGRPAVQDPKGLIEAIAAERARGYLPPQAFCAMARRMLARGLDAKLGHSLLSLRLRGAVAHLDALAAFRFERDGDLVTAGANELHVFLFGCQQADAQGTLARLLRVPVADIAVELDLVTATIDINMGLEAIASRAHVNPPTDWSGLLKERLRAVHELAASAAPAVPSPPASSAVAPVSSLEALQAHELALPPGTRVLVPHALPVRSRVH